MEDFLFIRHNLHRHAGLSGNESFAHDLIVSTLQPMAPTCLFQHVGGYGVIAFWGDIAKPCIAFRADTDALPITETQYLPYASEEHGVSHKCGHDGHTTILLRLARLAKESNINQMLLVFQPEEETGLGSKKILESGILQQFDIRYFFALHNLPGYPMGQPVICKRTFSAASTGVIYRLKGRQTHASTPEKGLNPGLCTASIIQRFALLCSGENVPQSDFTQSTLICVRLGEEAFGTSAGNAEIMFTLRAFTNTAMSQLLENANEIVREEANKHCLDFECELREPFNATENSCDVAEELNTLLQKNGYRVAIKETPFRWSEDFADYLMNYKGAMFGIGAGTELAELHHPHYDFPDQLTEPAAQTFLLAAKHFQAKTISL